MVSVGWLGLAVRVVFRFSGESLYCLVADGLSLWLGGRDRSRDAYCG